MVLSNLLIAAWIELLVCWIAWCLAFVKPNRQAKGQQVVARAPSSRIGIGLISFDGNRGAYTWWPLWVTGAVAFIPGTEIRVRAEERLLEQRFQGEFREYRSSVRAYIPFVR